MLVLERLDRLEKKVDKLKPQKKSVWKTAFKLAGSSVWEALKFVLRTVWGAVLYWLYYLLPLLVVLGFAWYNRGLVVDLWVWLFRWISYVWDAVYDAVFATMSEASVEVFCQTPSQYLIDCATDTGGEIVRNAFRETMDKIWPSLPRISFG